MTVDRPECEHDWEFIAVGFYDGQRPGFSYDEFSCRRCLATRARQVDGYVVDGPLDPRWYRRQRLVSRDR